MRILSVSSAFKKKFTSYRANIDKSFVIKVVIIHIERLSNKSFTDNIENFALKSSKFFLNKKVAFRHSR